MMKDSVKKTRQKRMKDGASATLITTLISMMFLMATAGFSIDLAKNAYMYQALKSRAQEAATGSIRSVGPTGTLGYSNVQEFQRIYFGNDLNSGGKYESAAYKFDESNGFRSDRCESITVPFWRDGNQQANGFAPYMVYQLTASRAETKTTGIKPNNWNPTYISSGAPPPLRVDGNELNQAKWSAIDVRVHDSRANLFLGMFGMPCQDYTFQVGAVKFGEKTDS